MKYCVIYDSQSAYRYTVYYSSLSQALESISDLLKISPDKEVRIFKLEELQLVVKHTSPVVTVEGPRIK